MKSRQAVSQKPGWQIWVSRGERLVFHARCADEKECQGLATEARSTSSTLRIAIRDPFGRLYPWD